MAQILDVYEKYKVMPQLQEHQFRVAAVAKQIAENMTVPVDTDSVIKASLLHDIANIIKFDLSVFPEYSEPEGLEYWKKVQADIISKYGDEEHQASLKIARELNMSPEILDYLGQVGFEKATENARRQDYETKICAYADMRVSPNGVVSIQGRLDDMEKRYFGKYGKNTPEQQEFDRLIHIIEGQIFQKSKIKPADITDESIEPILKNLRAYEI
jgi:HD superfamily phosphodiesterase